MIFYLLLWKGWARIEEDALLKRLEVRKNLGVLDQPFFPSFAAWDSEYTGTFSVLKTDLVEIKATSVFSYPKLFISVNDGEWESLKNDTFTQVSLTRQQNSVKVLSSVFNRYHEYINNSYEIAIFLDSFEINATFQTEDFEFFASGRDNNCSVVHNNTRKYLNFTIGIEQAAVITVRKVSYVKKDDFVSVSGNTFFSYPEFFEHWLESVLEVVVSNSTSKQVFFFRFHAKIPNYEISKIGASFDVPVDYYGWDLMPRFHPQVYNYTLVGRFPSLAFGKLRIEISTFYVAVCFISINQTAQIPNYMWRTNTPSEPIWMLVKEDNFHLYCASLGFEYYTKNYTISYYRKSKLITISKVKAFLNPLKSSPGSYSSNSSNLLENFKYSNDLSILTNWSLIESFKPPEELLLTYKTYSSLLTFNPIQYPLTPTGVSFLFTPSDLGAYFFYNLNGDSPERDYFFSFKSVYPLRPGNNVVFLNITAEDRTYTQYNKYTIPVLDPDTSIKILQFSLKNQTKIFFNMTESSEYVFNITEFDEPVLISGKLNNSKSIHEILDDKNFLLIAADDFINFSVVPENFSVSDKVVIRVYAESRNWVKDYFIVIQKVDTCGNGRRFSDSEECDDGNNLSFDGCFDCRIEMNWSCSGGNLSSFDTCSKVQVNESSQNNMTDGNSTNNSTTDNSTHSGNSTDNGNSTDDGDSVDGSIETSSPDVPGDDDNSEESSNDSSFTIPESLESSESGLDESSMDQSSGSSSSLYESSSSNDTNFTDDNLHLKTGSKKLFFDGFLPYYWIFSTLTVLICLGHLITSFLDRKSVKKSHIGGLFFTCIPMISTFQMFYLISTTGKIEQTSFFNSFKWTFFIPYSETQLKNIYSPMILFIIFVLLNLIQLVVYFLEKLAKTRYFLKNLKKLVNLSGPIYLFSILSPAIFSSCLLLLKNPRNLSHLMEFSMTVTIFALILSMSVYLLIISKKHSKTIGKKISKKYEVMFRGIQKIFLTVPVNARKNTNFTNQVPKNTLIKKIKRKRSLELKISEEKPKFFSCPWKKESVKDDSIEIPEFELFDPIDEVDKEKILNDFSIVKLKVNHYQVSMISCYVRFMLLSLSSVHFMFYYVLAIESFFQMIYFTRKLPFENLNYNIFHIIATSNQFLIFLLLAFVDYSVKTMSIFIFAISLLHSLSFIFLNIYEITFFLLQFFQKHRKSLKKTLPSENNRLNHNEKSEIIEIHENFYTEPVQSSREVPLRNCLSFIQLDLSFS